MIYKRESKITTKFWQWFSQCTTCFSLTRPSSVACNYKKYWEN